MHLASTFRRIPLSQLIKTESVKHDQKNKPFCRDYGSANQIDTIDTCEYNKLQLTYYKCICIFLLYKYFHNDIHTSKTKQ